MTITLSQKLNCNYFDIVEQDVDDVIILINYFVDDGKDAEQRKSSKNDGFWDM